MVTACIGVACIGHNHIGHNYIGHKHVTNRAYTAYGQTSSDKGNYGYCCYTSCTSTGNKGNQCCACNPRPTGAQAALGGTGGAATPPPTHFPEYNAGEMYTVKPAVKYRP